MSRALDAAYQYYVSDIDLVSVTDENGSYYRVNDTTKRDRGEYIDCGDNPHCLLTHTHTHTHTHTLAAIVFLTDGNRVSEEEQVKTKAVVKKYCDQLTMVSMFILVSVSDEGNI